MNPPFSPHDLCTLAPLLIICGGALLVLLITAFASPPAVAKSAYPLTLATLIIALASTFLPCEVSHPLLMLWLRTDGAAQFFTLFFLGVGLPLALLSAAFFRQFSASQGEYYFLFLSSLFGLLLMGVAADFLVLFIGLETSSLSLYVLCGYMKRWKGSEEAAIKYFLIGAFGTAFFVYGIALLYGAVGSTRFDDLFKAYSAFSQGGGALFFGGIAFVTAGLAFKAAIVPFHTWAPDVYCGAVTPVAAFMAVASKGGAFAAFVRIFAIELHQFSDLWNNGLAFLSALTLIYANFVALRQTNLRRFFAYSSISHSGFLLFPFIAATPDALPAFSIYLSIYAIATLGGFSALALVDRKGGDIAVEELRGLFYRAPFQASSLALCLFTLAGIPPTAGFLAKLYLFKVAFEAGYGILVVLGLLTSTLAVFYYLRILSLMLAKPCSTPPPLLKSRHLQWLAMASCVLLFLLSLYPQAVMMEEGWPSPPLALKDRTSIGFKITTAGR